MSLDSLIRWILLSVLLLAMAVLVVVTGRNYREYQKFREREFALAERVEIERQRFERQKRFLDRLLEDPDFLETVVRDRLGYARPDELVFRFPEE